MKKSNFYIWFTFSILLIANLNVIGQEILSDTVFQWGGGIDYKINENFSVFADFTILANDADISSTLYSYDPLVYDELSTQDLTVGVNYRF